MFDEAVRLLNAMIECKVDDASKRKVMLDYCGSEEMYVDVLEYCLLKRVEESFYNKLINQQKSLN